MYTDTKYFNFIGAVKVSGESSKVIEEVYDRIGGVADELEKGGYSSNKADVAAAANFFTPLKNRKTYMGGKDSIRVDVVDYKGEKILVVDCSAGGWLEWAAIPEEEIEVIAGTFTDV